MMRVMVLVALSFCLAPAAQAYRGERVVYTGGELSIDGVAFEGNRRERFLHMQDLLRQCPATEGMARRRQTTQNVGQGVGLGGLVGTLVVGAVNPLALGAVIGFAAVSITGNGVAIGSIASIPKLVRTYEEECL